MQPNCSAHSSCFAPSGPQFSLLAELHGHQSLSLLNYDWIVSVWGGGYKNVVVSGSDSSVVRGDEGGSIGFYLVVR